jgi:phosphoribosylanthranilate isomerase
MKASCKPKIKICCIASEEEALMAIGFGASALGLVGKMPSGPGPIDDERIAAIARVVPPPVSTFLLSSETEPEAIVAHHRRTHTPVIQLVDAVREEAYPLIRQALPGVKLVQVIHVIDENSLDEALRVAPWVDALLLDSGNPRLAVKELGGTGRVHDWSLSRKIREAAPIPLFLAGGLRPENVRRAIEEVEPFGLDLCTGVRGEGRLDPHKLERFFEAAEKG